MRAEAYAPGRVELLGNHTDYNEGVVLAPRSIAGWP
jgi:galactokinase